MYNFRWYFWCLMMGMWGIFLLFITYVFIPQHQMRCAYVCACVCVCEIMSIYNENLWFYAHQNKLLTYSHFLLQTWGRMGAWESFAGTLGETMARNGGSTCPRMLQYVSSNLFSLDWFFLRQELRFLRVKKFSWKKIKCS